MKPFFKWVGGKSRLLPEIKRNLPLNFSRIVEPFAGGAALSFDQERYPSLLNDLNEHLVSALRVTKGDLEALKSILYSMEVNKDNYLLVRSQSLSLDIEKAARFLFLNKTAFNGMWRENKQGKFNVPYGKGKDGQSMSDLLPVEHLDNAHTRLQSCSIENKCFKEFFNTNSFNETDFVFLDPPYVNTWDSYKDGGFDYSNHQALAEILIELDQSNVPFMLTNSDNEVTRSLYSSWNIKSNTCSYVLGGKNASRHKRSELMVTNY